MPPPRRLLVVVSIALLGGQLLGSGRHAPLAAGALALAAAIVLARRHAHSIWIAACACTAAIGILQVDALLRPRLSRDHIAHATATKLEAFGRVRDAARDASERVRLTIDVDAIARAGIVHPARGRALVTVARAHLPWEAGDRVRAPLRFRRPRNFGNPGEFDYEAFLARRQIYVTAFAMNDAGWERTAAPVDDQSLVSRWRADIRTVLSQSLPDVAQRITAALIIGDTSALPSDLWQRYARTGVAHVLSISGLHIALVATAGFTVSRWVLSRSEWLLLRASVPKLAIVATTLPVGVYGLLAGGSSPTLRSITVMGVLAIGTVLNRRRDWPTSLGAAALLISAAWPGAVFEIAFQLSFMSVLTILIGMKPVGAWWHAWEEARLLRLRPQVWRWRILRAGVLTLATSACAALGTAPLTAFHFNQISLITLVANLMVIPLLGMVPVSAGLLASLCVPIAPAVASVLFQIGGLFIECADWLVALLAQVPGAAVRTISPSVFELILIYGILGAAFLGTGRTRTITLIACSAILIGDVGYWYRERFHCSRLRVTFLSVGHGDCAVVEFPGATVMVIDGGGLGGSFDIGERVVAPYLWRRKIAQVDTLVLSHADYDHYGGLSFLARTFRPRALWWNGIGDDGPTFRQLQATLREHDVPALEVRRGFRARIDAVDLDVLGPSAGDSGSLNDQSVVLRLRYGPTALLFTGDIEDSGERRLVAHQPAGLRAHILKAPHHGSRTSSSHALLAAVQPTIAIVSTGFANRFHMPHADVLARYAAQETELWRTDLDGAIVVDVAANGTVTINGTRHRAGPERRRISPAST